MSELPGYLKLAKAEAKRAPEDDLVRRHLVLAVVLANRVRPPGLAHDDRLGVANLALVEAARTYPTSPAARRGVPFPAYAAVMIRHALWQASRATWAVYVPPDAVSQMRQVAKVTGRLGEALDRPPTDAEVAAELGWPVEKVRLLRRLLEAPEALPLDAVVPGDDSGEDTFLDTLPDPTVDVEAEVTERLVAEQERAALARAIDELPPLMRAALSLRAGIPVPGVDRLTVNDVLRVAADLPSHTAKALRKLREEYADGLRPYRPEPAGVVGDDRGHLEHFGRAPAPPDEAARQHRAEDVWRRLAGSGQLPPALAGVAQ